MNGRLCSCAQEVGRGVFVFYFSYFSSLLLRFFCSSLFLTWFLSCLSTSYPPPLSRSLSLSLTISFSVSLSHVLFLSLSLSFSLYLSLFFSFSLYFHLTFLYYRLSIPVSVTIRMSQVSIIPFFPVFFPFSCELPARKWSDPITLSKYRCSRVNKHGAFVNIRVGLQESHEHLYIYYSISNKYYDALETKYFVLRNVLL